MPLLVLAQCPECGELAEREQRLPSESEPWDDGLCDDCWITVFC